MKIVLLSLGIYIALIIAYFAGYCIGIDKGLEIALNAFTEVFDSMNKNKEQEDEV